MKILVVGSGGREHALAWKLANDSGKPDIFCAPGNAGTAEVATNLDIGVDDSTGLVNWAVENKPDLTVVGPEAPLCAGLVDRLNAAGLAVFGPTRDAATLEGSKMFAKDVMQAGGVPTAVAKRFDQADAARAYVAAQGYPIVIKADGLAAGKGVYICTSAEESEQAIQDILISREFGDAGNELLVEACLVGEEASILALVDGEHIVMLASSQDHKRAFNGDTGPNTGGMGAYSPAPVMADELWPIVREQVFQRTLDELKKRGITYKGVLYAGLMITADGPSVLEFNCRFGDPEIQAIVPRIDGDLLPALQACVDGSLTEDHIRWKDEACACVVMASGGYPGSYAKGQGVKGLDVAASQEDIVVFHAGTALVDGQVVTSGGRVLGVTALGDTLASALKRAYIALTDIEFDQAQYRTDIGKKALNRLS
jgi:phosphoribosylamine--glycine ligase